MKKIKVGNFQVGNDENLLFIAGPCVIESEEMTLYIANELKKIFSNFPFNVIFKASFDKANRTSKDSFRGVGIKKGLEILKRVKDEYGLAVLSDIHLPDQANEVASVCDMIQIPAFLCRQTDLLIAAAKTQKPINIKKGQFLAPWDMVHIVKKIESENNFNILLTDRGTSFGYNQLVSDMRSIPIMQKLGYPVCFDATHSIQLPGGRGEESGGEREFISPLSRAAIAAGANAIFLEVHPEPEKALSDAHSTLALKDLPSLLESLERIYCALLS